MFIAATSLTNIFSKFRNGNRRYTVSDIYKVVSQSEIIALTGNSGSGAFIDTSKCLHFGSRNNTKDRVVLMTQFLKTNARLLTNSIQL